MSRSRTILLGLAAAIPLCAATIAAIVPRADPHGTGVHEIRLVVRDMTYYVEGNSAPNPTLVLHRGEQVRVVLRNDDPGMTHDFAVDAWNARIPRIHGGEQASVQFQAPAHAGPGTYSCTPHGEMMRGTIQVE
jgi:hypothetical protein